MLAEFATWWVRQMRDLLPPRWRDAGGGPRSALVIDCAEPALTATCWRRTRGREAPLGTFALTDGADLPSVGRRSNRMRLIRWKRLLPASSSERASRCPSKPVFCLLMR